MWYNNENSKKHWFKKGHANSNTGKTHFKKGLISWNKGLRMPWKCGENHPNWKGGTSRIYKTGYYSREYIDWRKEVFERDKYTCQNCGDKKYITAHHIKSFAKYPKLRFDISNGKTLCELCHSLTDNYKGKTKKGNQQPRLQSSKVQRLAENSDILNNRTQRPLPEMVKI